MEFIVRVWYLMDHDFSYMTSNLPDNGTPGRCRNEGFGKSFPTTGD